jgi:hypothetical protein
MELMSSVVSTPGRLLLRTGIPLFDGIPPPH